MKGFGKSPKCKSCVNQERLTSGRVFHSGRQIDAAHWDEWVKGSCIDEEITALNLRSLSGDEPYQYLISDPALISGKVHPDAQWRYLRSKYGHVEAGGWWCCGVDIQKGHMSEWGCFKPNTPRVDSNGKTIKYEHPPKTQLEAFFLKVSPLVFELISRRYDVALPSDYTSVLSWPMIFWQWVIDNNIPIIITEGVKKAACILSRGYVAIALPGIRTCYRVQRDEYGEVIGQPTLIPQLAPFATPERRIYFAFDQDSKRSTRRDVDSAIAKTAKLFKKRGCTPCVMSWDRKLGKGIDDVLYNAAALGGRTNTHKSRNPSQNERAYCEDSQYYCEKTARFENAYPKSCWQGNKPKGLRDLCGFFPRLDKNEIFGNIYRKAQDFENWETQQMRQLTYEVDQSLDRRYLLNRENPNDTLPPTNSQLICLKAPKKIGKTEWIRWYVEPLLRSGEKRILLITHRIQLSTQTADRIGVPYVTEIKSTGEGNRLGMGLCIDSLHRESQARFNPDEWKNCYVVIDEVMQVIWHLLSSNTCTSHRVKIIKTLKQLLINVVKNGGRIIIADADLNDIAIDFIKGLIGFDVKTWIIENTYKFDEPWKVYHFQDKSPAKLVATLKQRLLRGEKHLLCVSAQKAKSRWGSTCLEAYYQKESAKYCRELEERYKKEVPGIKILRIDSETVADPTHPAYGCTSNINQIIADYDLVICTPTLETGVSIESEHFQGVWGIFQGSSPADSVRQHLSRYRPGVPRYIWVKSVGMGFVGDKSTNYKSLIASQRKLDKAHIKKLLEAGFEESVDGNFEPICLTTWAKLGAIINSGMWNYSEQIIADLAAEGHIIKSSDEANEDTFDGDDKPMALPNESQVLATKHDIDDNRDEQYQIYKSEVSASESIDDKQYEVLSKQQTRTKSELLKLRKAQLERTYNIRVDAELVAKDDDGWYSKIRLHYYFDVGRDFLTLKDSTTMTSLISEGDYFMVDMSKRLLNKKIDALSFLGIERLYQGTNFSKNHPVILDIFDKCKRNVNDLKLILGIDFSKIDDPITCTQRILNLIGHKMPFLRKQGRRGNQERIYGTPGADFEKVENNSKRPKYRLDDNGQAIAVCDGREQVFEQWLKRDVEAVLKSDKESQNIAPQENSAVSGNISEPSCDCTAQPARAKQPTQPQQVNDSKRCWVWYCCQWKQAIVKTFEDRPQEKFFKAVVELVGGLEVIVWQRECFEMAA
ncbi:plasmid replication protein, CyRepA1 family [Fischerella sp. PCC 9605]|uniref:plasmid replication protein, CyRepA1 family n=1 Tax=Fischerella sp. PCC 9605 TaxID=1173024 RepID=UPI00047BD709|nr:plasmid replication protein, CyRepA1 family [Fischerella sp. PCC 9605]